MTTNDIDARTIAADIMTGNARSITYTEIWAHIGQAYDTAEIDAMVVEEVADLIAKAGIDLIWPDGMKDTELGAARVEIERLRIEVSERTAERDAALDKARDDYADDNTRVAVALVDVQRKLAATEAERDAARDMANTARHETTQALHALDKARAVVEAAKTWRDWYAASPVRMQHLSDAEEALFAAVAALPTANTDDQPCCGYRCQDNTTGVTS